MQKRYKYNTKPMRAKWWNYDKCGIYFITIKTKNNAHYFGTIENKTMHLSKMGIIADLLWSQIPFHFPNVELSEYVIMPDHVHGILMVNNNDDEIQGFMTAL